MSSRTVGAVRVPLADGTVLRGMRALPQHPVATVLVQTPYGAASQEPMAHSWAERGIECWVLDVRGRYASGGAWIPYRHVAEDGLQAAAWAREHGSGGPLLLHGASYAAHTALETARALHLEGATPADGVAVSVPVLGPGETAWDRHGRPLISERVGWWHEHGFGPRSRNPLDAAEAQRRVNAVRARGVGVAAAWGWPPATQRAWRGIWSSSRVDPALRWGGMRSPLLVIGGRHDPFRREAAALARGWGGLTQHAEGPWGHGLLADLAPGSTRGDVVAAGGPGAVLDGWLARIVPDAHVERNTVPAPPRGAYRLVSELRPAARRWTHTTTAERPRP